MDITPTVRPISSRQYRQPHAPNNSFNIRNRQTDPRMGQKTPVCRSVQPAPCRCAGRPGWRRSPRSAWTGPARLPIPGPRGCPGCGQPGEEVGVDGIGQTPRGGLGRHLAEQVGLVPHTFRAHTHSPPSTTYRHVDQDISRGVPAVAPDDRRQCRR